MRREKRALDAFDQWNNSELGAFPVEEDQSGIPFVCLGDSSENETENRRLHPKGWMGKELKNERIDRAMLLLSLLTFLMPAFRLGDMKGDAKHFDDDGNLLIVKEQEVSEPENNPPNGESDSNDEAEETGTVAPAGNQTETETVEPEGVTETGTSVAETNGLESDSDIEFIEEVPKKPMAPPLIVDVEDVTTVERIDGIKVKLKPEPAPEVKYPTPSTSTASILDPAMGVIQAQIQQLTRLFNQHLNKSDSIIEGAQTERVKAITVTKEEPKDAEPPTDKEQDSDTKKCIQNLEDHLAATQTVTLTTEPPNPQVPEADSGVKETPTTAPQPVFALSGYETNENPERQQSIRKDVLQDSDTENQGFLGLKPGRDTSRLL